MNWRIYNAKYVYFYFIACDYAGWDILLRSCFDKRQKKGKNCVIFTLDFLKKCKNL